jgi:hypothetical protein
MRTGRKWCCLGLAALLAAAPVMSAGAQEETETESAICAADYTFTFQSTTDETVVYSASAVEGSEEDTIEAYFDEIPADTYMVTVTYLNAAAGNTSTCARTEWESGIEEGSQGTLIADYNLADEEIDVTVKASYKTCAYIDDLDGQYYLCGEEDASPEDGIDIVWDPSTTRAGHDWYSCFFLYVGSEQGSIHKIVDSDGNVYGEFEVTFESPNLTDDSMMEVWLYLVPETGEIKVIEAEFPDEIKESNSRQLVIYDEDNHEVERKFFDCVTNGEPDFTVTVDDLAPGNYTFNWFMYYTAPDDYLQMEDEPLEWEQKEAVPLRITIGEEYVMSIEEIE